MDWFFILLVGFGLGLFVQSATFDVVNGPVVTQAEVIQHGAAYYHPETAKFTWK